MSAKMTIVGLTIGGLICVAWAQDFAPSQSPPLVKTTNVVLTTRAITAGEELTSDNCRVAAWPIPFVAEGHVNSLVEIENKVAIGPIPQNSVITATQIGHLVAPIALALPNSRVD